MAPLATELVAAAGGAVRIPSLREMLRIKAWLVVTRAATRDYVGVATLSRLRELDVARVSPPKHCYRSTPYIRKVTESRRSAN